MSYPVSIPLKLLHESKGHVVSIELKTGELYRGQLMHMEDTMNCLLDNVKVTSRDGQLHAMDQAYIRGAQIRWVAVPDALKHATACSRLQSRDQRSSSESARRSEEGGLYSA
jgi:small nuclear ribonucleoprotein D3